MAKKDIPASTNHESQAFTLLPITILMES